MSVTPPRAVHQQIADTLRREIAGGTLGPGAALPAEGELAVRFGVSRVTINRAVTELRREHLVEIRRGIGTFVTADDTVDYWITLPRALWAQVSAAADQDAVTIDAWIVEACRQRLERG